MPSPDWLPPVLNGDACFENSDYVTGLGLIYGIVDPAADGCVSLSQLLQPQSIGDLSVSAGFYKRPIAYWYSSIDGNVSIQLQQHALSNLPDAGLGDDLCLVDWQQDRHGFSNTDKYRSDPLVDWVMDAWNDHAEGKACPQPD